MDDHTILNVDVRPDVKGSPFIRSNGGIGSNDCIAVNWFALVGI